MVLTRMLSHTDILVPSNNAVTSHSVMTGENGKGESHPGDSDGMQNSGHHLVLISSLHLS